MKLNILLVLMTSLSLTACGFMSGYGQEAGANGSSDWGLKDARGDSVSSCESSYPISSTAYLADRGLPREIGGNFICVNGKPALPKDCQGREFRSEAQLRVFWEKYQLPVGLLHFECSTSKPTVPAQRLEAWQIYEKVNPTCKDARGRKRPCV